MFPRNVGDDRARVERQFMPSTTEFKACLFMTDPHSAHVHTQVLFTIEISALRAFLQVYLAHEKQPPPRTLH